MSTMKPARAVLKVQIWKGRRSTSETLSCIKCIVAQLQAIAGMLATSVSVMTLASVGMSPANLCFYALIPLQGLLLVIRLILYSSLRVVFQFGFLAPCLPCSDYSSVVLPCIGFLLIRAFSAVLRGLCCTVFAQCFHYVHPPVCVFSVCFASASMIPLSCALS